MQSMQAIHCPNCGKLAERYYLNTNQLVRTQCNFCDYLLVIRAKTGRVVEAYAPGMFANIAA